MIRSDAITLWRRLYEAEMEKNKDLKKQLLNLASTKTQKDYYTKYSKSEKGKAARAKASKKFRNKNIEIN